VEEEEDRDRETGRQGDTETGRRGEGEKGREENTIFDIKKEAASKLM
jgi:hypothetical protein